MRPSRRLFIASGLAAATLAGAAPLRADEPLQVVATTGMIADAAAVVGGDRVVVRALMGAGVDPHGYRQTRSDIVALAQADLVLWHGLYLEAQMNDFLRDLGRDRAVVAVGDTLPKELLLAHDHYADRYDPHIWMDPELWALAVVSIRDALIAADPGGAATYQANADAYLLRIEGLAGYAAAILATVPDEGRVLLTAHDAFKYFGRAYGFEVVGIQGISTQSEAGLARISDLVDLLVARDIGAVFVETSVSDRNIRALIEGASARGHAVTIGGELYSDAMGPPGTYEGTWIGMLDHNATTIARALGGAVPDRGMQGLLN